MCIRLTSFIMSITSLEIIAESSTITCGLFNQKRESPNDQKQTFSLSLREWLLFIFDRTDSSTICADHLSLNCFASSWDKRSSEEKNRTVRSKMNEQCRRVRTHTYIISIFLGQDGATIILSDMVRALRGREMSELKRWSIFFVFRQGSSRARAPFTDDSIAWEGERRRKVNIFTSLFDALSKSRYRSAR